MRCLSFCLVHFSRLRLRWNLGSFYNGAVRFGTTPLYRIVEPPIGAAPLQASLRQTVYVGSSAVLYVARMTDDPACVAGWVYGVLVLLFMIATVLAIIGFPGPPDRGERVSFIVRHLVYRGVPDLWAVLRPRDIMASEH